MKLSGKDEKRVTMAMTASTAISEQDRQTWRARRPRDRTRLYW
jgi:hypothetical protein